MKLARLVIVLALLAVCAPAAGYAEDCVGCTADMSSGGSTDCKCDGLSSCKCESTSGGGMKCTCKRGNTTITCTKDGNGVCQGCTTKTNCTVESTDAGEAIEKF